MINFLFLLGGSYTPPDDGTYEFFYHFDNEDYLNKWFKTRSKNYTGRWGIAETRAPQLYSGERMLFMRDKASYYGISCPFLEPITNENKTLVIQLEVKYQSELECGGAYLKLFTNENYNTDNLSNETHYSVMFGPDICGQNNQVQFIFRHKDKFSGEIEEKKLSKSIKAIHDKANHIYTLVVNPDNKYSILVDNIKSLSGSLLTDFQPPVNAPSKIIDPNDKKPSNWDEREFIDDPSDVMPDYWDEAAFIPIPNWTVVDGWSENEPFLIHDPEAKKPEQWDDELMGEWEPPEIDNPKCRPPRMCGKYRTPLVPNPFYNGTYYPKKMRNPDYQGPYQFKVIDNPDFIEDKHPSNFLPIYGVGIEVWSVNNEIGFNNILISHNEDDVFEWNSKSFVLDSNAQKNAIEAIEAEKIEKSASSGGRKGITLSELIFNACFTYIKTFIEIMGRKSGVKICIFVIGVILSITITMQFVRSENKKHDKKKKQKNKKKKH